MHIQKREGIYEKDGVYYQVWQFSPRKWMKTELTGHPGKPCATAVLMQFIDWCGARLVEPKHKEGESCDS